MNTVSVRWCREC